MRTAFIVALAAAAIGITAMATSRQPAQRPALPNGSIDNSSRFQPRPGGSGANCGTVNTNCPCSKQLVPVVTNNATYYASFSGTLSLQIHDTGTTQAGRWWWKFNVTAFSGTATVPSMGTIAISLDPNRTSDLSLMECVDPDECWPRKHKVSVYTRIRPSWLPGKTYRSREQFVMQNLSINYFGDPLHSVSYDVLNDVTFEDEDNPGPVVFTIEKVPVTVNP